MSATDIILSSISAINISRHLFYHIYLLDFNYVCQCFIYEKDTFYILQWTHHFERSSNRIISEILFKKIRVIFLDLWIWFKAIYAAEILKHLFHKESVMRIWQFCIVTKKKILWIMNSYLRDQWFLFRADLKQWFF